MVAADKYDSSSNVLEGMESDVRPSKRARQMEDTENTSTDKFRSYGVFISHRGPDTKTGFASFLERDLRDAGLEPFLDCKSIDVGEDSWECIEHAIKNTPIAVVIFSEGFAGSKWCLKELHVMLHSPGVKVIPVFYNVRPSEVRFPERGRMKDGFEKLTRDYDKTDIEEWRADLRLASQIAGAEHGAGHNGLEVDLVRKVVKKIVELTNKPLPLPVGDYVVGVKEVAEGIIKTLKEKKKVLILGLWGMGGIGKSTLARELYNRLSKRFDAACYIEDVTETVNKGGKSLGVVKVQNLILKALCQNTEEIEGKSKGMVILEERLCRKRILMVLDDVGDNEEMEYWITRKMLREGSMCIVTSRNRSVFEKSGSFDLKHEVHIHEVKMLDMEDSKRVFTSYAFGAHWKVKPGFEELVTSISKACGGVPLVLRVCGALLKNKDDVKIWEDVREKLNCGTIMDEKKIFDCLRISYDALSWKQQEMFLDVACALIGEEKDLAVRVWRSLQWSPEFEVPRLVERALIAVDEYGRLRMHDHLRDMGREVVREKRASEGIIRRLWMPESLKLLKEDKGLPHSLQSLSFLGNDGYKTGSDTIHVDLSYMKDLRILLSGSAIMVTAFPRKLLWYFGSVEDITIPSQNYELIILRCGSRILSLPESFGELRKLEELDMSGCKSLHMLPESFGRLGRLHKLWLQRSGIESLPESFGDLNKLQELDLSGCESLHMLPESFGRLKILHKLKLKQSGIESLPESFGDLSKLEELDMRYCESLHMLPESFGRLRILHKLKLWHSGIQCLPESFGELNKLEELNLTDLWRLHMLTTSFGRLRIMYKLCLKRSGIQSLPESSGELNKLEELDLSGCLSLLESFGRLGNLHKLGLQCSGIQSLPKSFGELSKLEELDMSRCKSLHMLPESFRRLGSLHKLKLNCSGIESLPESFGELSKLEELDLIDCENLHMLPESFGRLGSLHKLKLNCSVIESLPESFGELSKLEELGLSDCENLHMLPESFGRLGSLHKLKLEYKNWESKVFRCIWESKVFRSVWESKVCRSLLRAEQVGGVGSEWV